MTPDDWTCADCGATLLVLAAGDGRRVVLDPTAVRDGGWMNVHGYAVPIPTAVRTDPYADLGVPLYAEHDCVPRMSDAPVFPAPYDWEAAGDFARRSRLRRSHP